MTYPPIGDYALIGDCHSAALVSKDGSVDWCCFHRFDARPVFARLLDWRRGGHFRIGPPGSYATVRRYLPGTNVLETTFETDRGRLVLTDCFLARIAEPDEGGDVHPYHQLVRTVRCDEGSVDVEVDFLPRFEYGRTVPRLEITDGLGVVYGGPDGLVVDSDLPLERREECHGHAHARLHAGEEAVTVLTQMQPHRLRVRPMPRDVLRDRLAHTRSFWTDWSARCTYDGPYADAVVRSALVLKALTNAPTGAIVAAPTTSLPEWPGGVRNWDYRYTWLRDAALNLYALFSVGYTDEAHDFMGWVKRTTAGRADELQPLYGVGGEGLLPEIELGWLDGYRGSRPVRIGNDASGQLQLDVYGELLDTAWLFHRHGGEIDDAFWEFCRAVADVVVRRWEEPDDGIWETRAGRSHVVSSKVMCWVALDRAVKLARARGLPGDVEGWKRERLRIRRRVESEGFSPQTGAFRQAFGSDALDASSLLVPLVRFLPGDDERVRSNADAILRELTVDGLVYRYRTHDGLPGDEGAFLLCSFWLVDNLALCGRLGEATELFERLLGYANDVGLMSEEVDPASGALLGNFPQAFSHVGLIGAALNLQRAAERRQSR